MQPIVDLTILFWLYRTLQYRSSMSSNVLVFYTSGDISSRSAAFQFFKIFLSTMSSSSCVNCPSLMSNWLLIMFVIGSSVTFWDFRSRFLKYCFQCIRSSWLAAFSLALAVLFLLLTSFTVCHDILNCLSSTESLILLIWSWIYSVCSFRYYLPTPPLGQDMTQGQFLSGV